jgi:NAD(P)-dependent dehydrogenase (short-subunit alcohol dehydrogenase family)
MSASEDRFAGKVAVVTGGGSGVGAASVRRLAGHGASVVVVDVDETRGKQVAGEVGGRFVAADVGDPTAWERVVATAVDDLGGLDLVHLNAGIPTGPYPVAIEDVSDAQYRRVMGVNIDGVFFGVRACMVPMAEAGGGAIVATSSLAGLIPLPQDPVYGATKHAVIGLVRSLAAPLAERSITINAVCPGGIDTPLLDTAHARDEMREAGRPLMDPDEVAQVVADLMERDETGQAYSVLFGAGGIRYEFAKVRGHAPTADP